MRSSSSTSPRGECDRDPRRHDARVVDDDELAVQLVRQLGEPPVPHRAGRPLVDEQPRRVAPRRRLLRDQLGRQLVVQLGDVHRRHRTRPARHQRPPDAHPSRCPYAFVRRAVASPPMDAEAIKRAQARIDQAASGRVEPAQLDAALERAREQVEALAATAAELESTLPGRVGDARPGRAARRRSLPVGRNLAEIRGLMNQLIRRLERVEGDLLAERHARVDDLALLVDLVASGWRGVEQRLARIEARARPRDDAVVYRIEPPPSPR